MSSSASTTKPTTEPSSFTKETSSPQPQPSSTDAQESDASTPLTRLDSTLESELLSESQSLKATATTSYTTGDPTSALDFYTRALAPLPTYLSYDLAVLHANIAACHLRLEQWKEASTAASKAIDELAVADPVAALQSSSNEGKPGGKNEEQGKGKEEERVLEIDDELEARLELLASRGQTLGDVQKLRIKALLRRAKARTELGTWADLQGALEDYSALAKMELGATDRRTVQGALSGLPERLEEQKNKEMADMMGKLKQLGNGILKPFGLSTENFNFVKDEKTGGYSMNFNQ